MPVPTHCNGCWEQPFPGVDPNALAALEVLPSNIVRISDVMTVQPSFDFGDRVIFDGDADYEPWAYIRSGERGVVVRCDRHTGMVLVYMERHHSELEDYGDGNTIWFIPHHTDDVVPFVRVEGVRHKRRLLDDLTISVI
jgi:hypothetical protein